MINLGFESYTIDDWKKVETSKLKSQTLLIKHDLDVEGVDKAKQLARSYCSMRKLCKRRRKHFVSPRELKVCTIDSYVSYIGCQLEEKTNILCLYGK